MTIYKVINGKRYDTRTAELMTESYNGYNSRDFNWVHEELYRKKTGEYFLAGEGGPMTGYAEHIGSNRGYGEKIIPLSDDQARKWVEDHCSGDEYDRIFGSGSDDETARITISLPESLAKKLGIIAQDQNLSVSSLCRISIDRYIKHYEEDVIKYAEEVFQSAEEVSSHD